MRSENSGQIEVSIRAELHTFENSKHAKYYNVKPVTSVIVRGVCMHNKQYTFQRSGVFVIAHCHSIMKNGLYTF